MSYYPDTPRYYMPYDSGEDTDIGTDDEDYDSDELPDYEDARIRREEDPRYAIIRTAGPNFNTSAQQLKYMEHAPGAEYNPSTNISTLENLVYLDPPKTTQTSLFSIKSSNRDTRVWPSPFNFQIKTPRVYKNVTKFQLVQLSFPNNIASLANTETFYNSLVIYLESLGFTSSCVSSCINTLTNTGTAFTTIGVAEEGRTTTTGSQMLTKIEVANGLYTNQALANELTIQSNNTPPFNIISYNDFVAPFKINRDISVLFNEPGDNFHSNLSPHRHGRHTKQTIMETYFSQHHIDKHHIITDTIAFNAYYYPVLKELYATPAGPYFINLNGTGLTTQQAFEIIRNNFQGLDSNIYYTICSTNKHILDDYRKNHTFHRRNINKYVWSFNEHLQRFSCTHETLHTSLKNDIQNSFNKFHIQELTLASLTPNSFTTLKQNTIQNQTIFDHFTLHLSSQLTSYFLNETDYKYSGGDYHSSLSSGVWRSRTSNDLHTDISGFTTLFNFTSTFGRQYNTYSGKTFTFTNFLDYHSTMSSYYNYIQNSNNIISTINGNTYFNHHTYISSKYSDVLPSNMINNKVYYNGQGIPVAFIGNKFSYTPGDPVVNGEYEECVAKCKAFIEEKLAAYYSCLPVNGIIATLNYRLGIFKWPPSFSTLVTTLNTISSINFNFLLQINVDQSFNNMDIAMTENYNRTNQTTSQIKLMAAKILTGGVGAGEESQTCIQNPILFPNTLGKLDKLEFKIYADDNTITPMWLYFPFELSINEWDATFQIDEEMGFADRNTGWGARPTIPIPLNAAGMPYLALTSSNNPNNK